MIFFDPSWLWNQKKCIFAATIGEMAERSNAAVLKTVEGHTSGGSNPSLSADHVGTKDFSSLCSFNQGRMSMPEIKFGGCIMGDVR